MSACGEQYRWSCAISPAPRMCERVTVANAVDDLSLAEFVCLALVVEEARHGWALVRELDGRGEIGGVWSLSRPLTYRALDGLVERRLVVRRGVEGRGGPTRQMLSATPGRRHG